MSMIAKKALFICLILVLGATLTAPFTQGKIQEISTEPINGDGIKVTIWESPGVRKIIENGTLISIEDAKDLRSIWSLDYLEYDPDYWARIDSLNYSHMRVCLSVSDNWYSKGVPFESCNRINNKCTQEMIVFPGPGEVCRDFMAPKGLSMLAYNFTLGANSTSFWLRDADTESLDDGSWQDDGAQVNNGDYLYMGYPSNYSSMKKFNHTFLGNMTPENCYVSSSIISFYVSANSVTDPIVEVYEVINQSWSEDNFRKDYGVKWQGLIWTNDTFPSSTTGQRITFDITAWDAWLWLNSYENSSVFINQTSTSALSFFSKDYAVIGERPEKNITFTCEDIPGQNETNETAYGDYNITIPWCCDDYWSTIITNKSCVNNYTLKIEGAVWREVTSPYWNETAGYWDNKTAYQYCDNGCYEHLGTQGAGCAPPAFDLYIWVGGVFFIIMFLLFLFFREKGKRKRY